MQKKSFPVRLDFYKMFKAFFAFLLVFTSTFQVVLGSDSGDYIPDRACATLYSAPNFEGNSFVLNDFDQSVNLKRDYRASISGWGDTGSIRIESDCKLALCNETYFLGSYHMLTSNISTLSSIISGVRSANCTCSRECNCEDARIKRSEYGRAYLKGDCNTCDSEYITLDRYSSSFLNTETDAVTALIIRDDCTLTTYSGENKTGIATTFRGSVLQKFGSNVSSLQFSCKKEWHMWDALHEFYNYDLTLHGIIIREHGTRKRKAHAENGKSVKNAYIIVMGTPFASLYGFPDCVNGIIDSLSLCNIPVNMTHLGISEAELRLITVPLKSDDDDHKLMAELDEYLSQQEDFNEAVPNAVIIIQDINENGFTEKESGFQKKLQALHLLRHLLVDENYSNVLFLLDNLDHLSAAESRQPETKMSLFFREIIQKWSFPSPVFTIARSDKRNTQTYVNGYRKMENQEYWPRNLETSLANIFDKAGDPLGREILKAHFQAEDMAEYTTKIGTVSSLPVNNNKVVQYKNMLFSLHSQQPIWRNFNMKLEKHTEKIQQLEAMLWEKKKARMEDSERFNGILNDFAEKIKEDVLEKLKEDLNKIYH